MDYSIVDYEKQQVIGVTTRTGNNAPDCGQKIGALWQALMAEGAAAKIPDANLDPYTCFGMYYDYDFDDNSYEVMVGCASGSAIMPDGMKAVTIPGGKYAKFSIEGDAVTAVQQAWNEIWAMDLPRAYTVDFEAYLPGEDMQCARIDIFVALK